MALLAALALVLVLEGLGLAVFARSIPQIMAELDRVDGAMLRRIGVVAAGLGAAFYLVVRGGAGGG